MGEFGIWLVLLSNLQVKSFCLLVFWAVVRQEFDGVSFSGLWVDACCGVKCRAGGMQMDGRWWIVGRESVRGLKREQTGIMLEGADLRSSTDSAWSVVKCPYCPCWHLADPWNRNGDGSTQTDTQPFYRLFFLFNRMGRLIGIQTWENLQANATRCPFTDFIEFREENKSIHNGWRYRRKWKRIRAFRMIV